MHAKVKCCDINTMCGLSLWQGVIVVGSATLVISLVVLLMCIGWLVQMSTDKSQYNRQPLLAINLIFVFMSSSVSTYQIIISVLLLSQAFMTKGVKFICTLWYVSHLSILTLYCFLFSAKTIIAFKARYYLTASVSIVIGIVYKATFTYFCIVVNSYLHSIELESYF